MNTSRENRLAELKQRFVADLETRRADLQSAARPFDSESRERMIKAAHSLAGRGGTFGFPELSAHAYQLEELLLTGSPIWTDALAQTLLEIERITRSHAATLER